jgi:phage/plasmid-like protein (TIGR03299 family)
MSHELEILENGEAAMAYTGSEKPWHGLGKQVPADLTAAQMMKAANLDWTVSKRGTWFYDQQGNLLQSGDQVLVRDSDNRVLTTVKDSWKPVQNSEAFDFFHDFVNAGDMSMDTAGSLKDGKIVWALAKLNNTFEIFGGDVTESYLLFSNPHQYGKTVNIRLVNTRCVCANTLTLALGESAKFQVKLNHSREFNADKAKEAIGIAKNQIELYKKKAEFLGLSKYDDKKVEEFFVKVYGNGQDKTRTTEQALEILETQPGSQYAKGSWWQAFNAVTYMNSHILGRSEASRLESNWYGSSADRSERALELALDYAKA